MLQKASQIQEQLIDYKEEIRKKRILMQFQKCGRCQHDLEFSHEISHDLELGRVHISEHGHCPQCKGQIPSRKFTAH